VLVGAAVGAGVLVGAAVGAGVLVGAAVGAGALVGSIASGRIGRLNCHVIMPIIASPSTIAPAAIGR
jgi:hypothetical protein